MVALVTNALSSKVDSVLSEIGDLDQGTLVLLTHDEKGQPTWLARWAERGASSWLSVSGPVIGRDEPGGSEGVPMLLRYRACNEMWAVWLDPSTSPGGPTHTAGCTG